MTNHSGIKFTTCSCLSTSWPLGLFHSYGVLLFWSFLGPQWQRTRHPHRQLQLRCEFPMVCALILKATHHPTCDSLCPFPLCFFFTCFYLPPSMVTVFPGLSIFFPSSTILTLKPSGSVNLASRQTHSFCAYEMWTTHGQGLVFQHRKLMGLKSKSSSSSLSGQALIDLLALSLSSQIYTLSRIKW